MTREMKRQKQAPYDLKLLIPVICLVGIGIIMIYSSSSAIALKKFGSDYYFIKKQVAFALSGLLLLLTFRYFPYKLFHNFVYPMILLSCLFLILIHGKSFGITAGGATRWLRLGMITFQPAEFARFAMVLYLAYSLSKKQEHIQDPFIGFLPHVIILSLLSLLILAQPDFGSAAILAMLTWIMMFVGGVRVKHLILSLLPLLPLALMFMISAEYRLRRLLSFINPWEYPAEEGYQIIHSFMAFGTGGLFGTGIGKGYQKLFYLPEPHTDFIFSVIGEELGLLGVLFILALYMTILFRGIDIAKNSRDRFGCFMAAGITTAMGLQVCINMGVALGLLPTKGLTLPFLSYGGTSLVLNMASIGILMNIGASQSK
jgi:cell division protein FtsW